MTMLDPKGREAARLWAINATSDGGVPGDDYIDGILTAYLSTITPADVAPAGWFNPWNDYHGYQQVAKEYEGSEGTIPLYSQDALEAQAAELAAKEEARAEQWRLRREAEADRDTALASLTAERAALAEARRERDEALKAAGDQAILRGEAEGKLAASEMAGIVDGWKRRAEAYRNQRDEALKALEPFAKAGELFPGDDADFDQCIYRPAAGDEYALSGNHLRAARRVREGGKADG